MELFNRNYKAVVDRGLIKPNTIDVDFYYKLKEELGEVSDAMLKFDDDNINEEVTDCLVVCSNWLTHRGCNIEQMLTQIAEKNEKRAKQSNK